MTRHLKDCLLYRGAQRIPFQLKREPSPGGSESTEIRLQCRRRRFSPWVRKMPWRREWQPTPGLLPGKSHGQRSLAGYRPWGHRERNTAERLAHFPEGGSGPGLPLLLDWSLAPLVECCCHCCAQRYRVNSEFNSTVMAAETCKKDGAFVPWGGQGLLLGPPCHLPAVDSKVQGCSVHHIRWVSTAGAPTSGPESADRDT